MERLTARRDSIAQDMANVVAFEVELETNQTAMEGQVNVLSKGGFFL